MSTHTAQLSPEHACINSFLVSSPTSRCSTAVQDSLLPAAACPKYPSAVGFTKGGASLFQLEPRLHGEVSFGLELH